MSARVWLTRAPHDQRALADALRSRGWEVHEIPLLRRNVVPDARARCAAASPADLLLFTSAAAVDAVGDARELPSILARRVVAVGPRTADAARARGWSLDAVGEGRGADLIAALDLAPGVRVLWPRAEPAADETFAALRAAGADLADVVVYALVDTDAPTPSGDPPAWVVLASPSAARAVARRLPPPLPAAIAIGPTTAAAAHEAGFATVHVARAPHTLDADALAWIGATTS
jgi:uroporphyrinogen-III synthase